MQPSSKHALHVAINPSPNGDPFGGCQVDVSWVTSQDGEGQLSQLVKALQLYPFTVYTVAALERWLDFLLANPLAARVGMTPPFSRVSTTILHEPISGAC
jgi:hypothetical protein